MLFVGKPGMFKVTEAVGRWALCFIVITVGFLADQGHCRFIVMAVGFLAESAGTVVVAWSMFRVTGDGFLAITGHYAFRVTDCWFLGQSAGTFVTV